ncbi:MAG: hypothetical protein NTZ74_11640 [Chloroflexi bacterium]|nr:hypothetical protein [Chloroflexota bacterium]
MIISPNFSREREFVCVKTEFFINKVFLSCDKKTGNICCSLPFSAPACDDHWASFDEAEYLKVPGLLHETLFRMAKGIKERGCRSVSFLAVFTGKPSFLMLFQ